MKKLIKLKHIYKSDRIKNKKSILCLLISVFITMNLTACGQASYPLPYDKTFGVDTPGFSSDEKLTAFAANLCVITDDISTDDELTFDDVEAAVLFDLDNKNVIYSKNAHEQLYPASLTKVMTALVALDQASPDMVLTATDAVKITEAGAQLIGVKSGDTMTLDQALHILLMYSANDVAMLIAENIGGTVDDFVAMMNKKAAELGATNTHFVNPHGLTDSQHYTTAYDLYLIFNEAIKYEKFNEIIHTATYQTTYYSSSQTAKKVEIKNSNSYINGTVEWPENITIIGGKTGTTSAAGNCLILYSTDVSGSPYISVILKAQGSSVLYSSMTKLLNELNS